MIKLRNITIKTPKGMDCDKREWSAKYGARAYPGAVVVQIESRSAISVIVTKIAENGLIGPLTNYYISSPNFGIAIPAISSLQKDSWITEQLLNNGMPAPDAVTIAQVLRDMGDF